MLAGAKKKLACDTMKEEPITPEILASLLDRFGDHEASLSDVHWNMHAGVELELV